MNCWVVRGIAHRLRVVAAGALVKSGRYQRGSNVLVAAPCLAARNIDKTVHVFALSRTVADSRFVT
jgi:hypothetical protein